MGRHPIDRMISYYYEIIFIHSMFTLNDITIEELQFYSKVHRFSSNPASQKDVAVLVDDDGISESMCRALADEKITTGQFFNVRRVDRFKYNTRYRRG